MSNGLLIAAAGLLLAVFVGGAIATNDLPPCWPNCVEVIR